MSWIQRIENIPFTIITGDGTEFTPLWKNGQKSKDYNVSTYNFINVKGGFVDRKQPAASKFPLTFWFQGEDCIEQADAFERSADDSRPWTIKHPFYGTLQGQPLNLRRNDSDYNVTEITIEFWESVSEDYPASTKSVKDAVFEKSDKSLGFLAQAFSNKVVPTTEFQQDILQSVVQASSAFKTLYDDDNFSGYQNSVNTANASVGKINQNSLDTALAVQQVYMAPSLFAKAVKSRIEGLSLSYAKTKASYLERPNRNNKIYFELAAGASICAMCQAGATPLSTDYVTRTEIENVSTLILSTYEDYLQTLDTAQVTLSNTEENFYPGQKSQFAINLLVMESVNNLFDLAFAAKQERTFEVKEETNLILLTHRFFGIASDSNLEAFRELNGIRKDELFRIKPGRVLKYYV